MNWEALPQRHRRSRAGHSSEVGLEISAKDPCEQDVISRNEAQVNENIEARKRIRRVAATLEGKDGCAGENYEYLDHTADVQFHTWGPDLVSSLETLAPCMFNFITDLATVEENATCVSSLEVKAHDMYSLLFAYLDELLFRFCTDGFCCKRLTISHLDRDKFVLKATVYGEQFDPSKHPQGTEIKAITYSNMQIHETEGKCDIYVIVDI